jgi:glycosyltransferase involved in cell wall biosynthesis
VAPGGQREPVVLYAGRLTLSKNVDRLIEAVALLGRSDPVRLVICGDGLMRSVLADQVQALGLEACVTMTGHLERRDVLARMREAAACVFLSEYEGFPNVVGEAIQCGTPIIVSDIRAHRDLLGSDCAVFVNPRKAAEVAEAIRSTLHNRPAAAARATRAKERMAGFSVEAMTGEYESLYYRLASRSGVDVTAVRTGE